MSNNQLVAIPDQVKEIGPFPGTVTPARIGMYRRVSPRSGRKVWAWFDGSRWCKYSTNIDKALQKSKRPANSRSGRSRRNDLPWFGLDASVGLNTSVRN
jgi:hypothetical protein